eukprot:GHVU01222471.1.p1 GENE.GHVU01222471.1~~GHVU01222471.1.p1  ORF type:complete len:271 (-),score=24.26 GHVU01222471.1:56-868(-)
MAPVVLVPSSAAARPLVRSVVVVIVITVAIVPNAPPSTADVGARVAVVVLCSCFFAGSRYLGCYGIDADNAATGEAEAAGVERRQAHVAAHDYVGCTEACRLGGFEFASLDSDSCFCSTTIVASSSSDDHQRASSSDPSAAPLPAGRGHHAMRSLPRPPQLLQTLSRSVARSLAHARTASLHSWLTHSFTHLLTYSRIPSLIPSLIHSGGSLAAGVRVYPFASSRAWAHVLHVYVCSRMYMRVCMSATDIRQGTAGARLPVGGSLGLACL